MFLWPTKKNDNPNCEDRLKGAAPSIILLHYTGMEDGLSAFEVLHDPTQLNRQGPDVGTQYRSAIFYHDEEQKRIAQDVIDEVNKSGLYDKPVVTTLEPAATFWEAEGYHQQYYEKYEKEHGQPHINDWLKRQSRQLKGE